MSLALCHITLSCHPLSHPPLSLSRSLTLTTRDGRLADRLERAAQDVKAAFSECPSYDVVRVCVTILVCV